MPDTHTFQMLPDSFRLPTPDERQRLIRRAHIDQARTIRLFARLMTRALRRSMARGAAAIGRVLHSFAEYCRHRNAMAGLNGLSDATLKDIGVSRSEIPWLARHGRRDRERFDGRQRLRLIPGPASNAPHTLPLPTLRKHAA